MLLLTISLFLNYDLFSCVDYQRSKFNETILMKQHHKNYVQVKTFIKEAQKKFHEDTPPSGVDYPHYTTREWDNTPSIDLDLNTRVSVPSTRARPFFAVSITPYTTALIAHKLKWDEIVPLLTTRKSVSTLRFAPKVSSTRKISSLPPFKMSLPSPMYEKRFSFTLLPSVSKLLINHVVSSTLRNRPNRKLFSKTYTPSLKNQKSFGATSQTSNSQNSTRPSFLNSTFHTSLRGNSSKGVKFNPSHMTRNEEYKKKWLSEITTYTPVENWFLTLGNNIELTPRFGLTTKHTSQLGKTHSKTEVSALRKQLMTDSKHQKQAYLRNAVPTPKTTTKVVGYSISTATTKAKYYIENQGGILHLRTVPEKDEAKTTTVGKRPVPASAKDVKITDNMLVTTGHMLKREQETAAYKSPSEKKSRRLHLKHRKRHRYLRHKNLARQRYQRLRYRHPEYRYKDVYRRKQEKEDYPMLRSSIDTPKEVFKSNEEKHGEPTHPPNAMLQLPEYINTENDNFSKLIETQKASRRKEKAQKDKIYFYNQVKETLKQAESKKKAKRLKIKAELIRKIVEGSSYSDEEESLRKNLIQALQNGNRT